MNYEELSDFEINKMVMAIAKNWKGATITCTEDENKVGYSEPLYIQGARVGSTINFFDPCNNPSDAWPIIVENRISLEAEGDDEWTASTAYYVLQAKSKNPLRAAMIVYLMMQEQVDD